MKTIILAAAFILGGCSNQRFSKVSQNQDVSGSGIVGSWQSPCFFTAKDHSVDKSSHVTYLEISKDHFVATSKGYTRAECASNKENRHSFTAVIKSSYILKAAQDDDKKIDFKIEKISLTHHIKSQVDELNDIVHFGFNNWEIDKEKDIAGRKMNEDTAKLPSIDDFVFDLITIKQALENEKLYFGLEVAKLDESKAGRTEGDRPKKIFLDEYYLRLPDVDN